MRSSSAPDAPARDRVVARLPNRVGAAKVVALVVVGLLFTGCQTGGGASLTTLAGSTETSDTARSATQAEPTIAPSPTTAAPMTAATIVDAGEDFDAQVVQVEAMVAARNSGDYEAWRAYFPAERPTIWGATIVDESQLEWQRSYVAANEIWTITDQCQPTESGVSCPMTLVNDFFGPAGIFFAATVDYRFNGNGEISYLGTASWTVAGDPGEYSRAFDDWLFVAYPDVHATFAPRVEGEDGLPAAEDMPTALEYVDEFLAQSDAYPLGG